MAHLESELARSIDSSAQAELDSVVELRRSIHRDPELGLGTNRTRDRIAAALSELPVTIKQGDQETAWLTADLDGATPGPTVLLRADTDALPMTEDNDFDFRSVNEGIAHTCGHDAHVAMLVGAARLLTENRESFAGTVRLAFQPGEEGDGGALRLIDEGVLEGVDAAYALHITPNIPSGFASARSGPIMASANVLTITVIGRGGHASSPHFCTDPITVAAHIITSIQTMVTRELNAFDPAVITIAQVQAGSASNIIPERAELTGTIRTVSEVTRIHVHDAIRRVAAGVAAAHGATVEVTIDEGYPVTVNHGSAVDLVSEVVGEIMGPDRWFDLPTPIMGAEDFSYFLQKVPGAMTLLGVCPTDIADSLTAPPCHSNKMRLHEPAMANGVAIHTGVAISALRTLANH